MVIVELTGGLGNQMFQYALGYHLAKKNGVGLLIDTSFFENYEWHEYGLSPLSIQAREVNLSVPNIPFFKKILKWLRILLQLKTLNFSFVREQSFEFDDKVLKSKNKNVYLKGYWQSEKYFEFIKDDIIRHFFIKTPPSQPNADLLHLINNSNSISVHIRRGNYVNVEFVNKVHGTSPLSYYEKGMEYINKYVKDPHYFVFSDDIAWAKENLIINDESTFVDINDAKSDYEDLRLMQSCKHSIIANSTFSWWGAWLNQNPDKIVIAPQKWFMTDERNIKDLFPIKWICF